ncbi:tetratricopeptide repeat protein [bacterium]|nr:tetratricopeptide repeat protein [bacterium]
MGWLNQENLDMMPGCRPLVRTLALALSGLCFGTVDLAAADSIPLSEQLVDLGRQARTQGHPTEARKFYEQALKLDPANGNAREAIDQLDQVRQVAMKPIQDAPAPAAENPAAPGQERPATLETVAAMESVRNQQFAAEIRQKQQAARNYLNANNPDAALNALRQAQNMVRSATDIPEATRVRLDRELQASLLAATRQEERNLERQAEDARLGSLAEARSRSLEEYEDVNKTVGVLMEQFDNLINQGIYNVMYSGGFGSISESVEPFVQARLLAQKARAMRPNEEAPIAAEFVSARIGFYALAREYEALKEFNFMLSLADVDRAAVPFPDDQFIAYPPVDRFREITEKRAKYREATDLVTRDPQSQSIIDKLNDPISLPFPNETPFEDVLKYITQNTQGPNDNGIQIHVDPIGLEDASATMQSPVTINLEGVPLKRAMKIMLDQLDLTYTVQDGVLFISWKAAEDLPTDRRVYPVADLALIPMSLMTGFPPRGGFGGGMGGMGGGMGGMGGGMGGMGGGMGGMGGGMGGMGGGMGGMGGMGGGMGGMGGGMR